MEMHCIFVRQYLCNEMQLIKIVGGEKNANIQPVSEKRTSDICKEVYSSGTSEKLQFFEKEKHKYFFSTEERRMYCC